MYEANQSITQKWKKIYKLLVVDIVKLRKNPFYPKRNIKEIKQQDKFSFKKTSRELIFRDIENIQMY